MILAGSRVLETYQWTDPNLRKYFARTAGIKLFPTPPLPYSKMLHRFRYRLFLSFGSSFPCTDVFTFRVPRQ